MSLAMAVLSKNNETKYVWWLFKIILILTHSYEEASKKIITTNLALIFKYLCSLQFLVKNVASLTRFLESPVEHSLTLLQNATAAWVLNVHQIFFIIMIFYYLCSMSAFIYLKKYDRIISFKSSRKFYSNRCYTTLF